MPNVAVFHPDTAEVFLCTEQPHPADARFLAYQRNGLWLGVSPQGSLTWTSESGSWQAFTKLPSLPYLLADRTVWSGQAYRLGISTLPNPTGPAA